MNYCITGAAGNISNLLIKLLLQSGHKVKVIGRSEKHLQELKSSGADIAIGSIRDEGFLKTAFAGADAVYTMCPAILNHKEGLIAYCEETGENYRQAIEVNNIPCVVNLSSVGAHLSKGAGHITGMNRVEQKLNQLKGVSIRHLRPVYFYTNLFAQTELIKNLGIMGSNFSMKANTFPLADPSDIAHVAYKELTALNFTGHSFRYIASDERGTDDIAEIIGKAIDKPDLKWIKFSDEQAFEGMLQAGFSERTAMEFIEGFGALQEGKITEDYWQHRPELGKVKLEDFAKKFAMFYAASMKPLNLLKLN